LSEDYIPVLFSPIFISLYDLVFVFFIGGSSLGIDDLTLLATPPPLL
jgi:hypothetical protein